MTTWFYYTMLCSSLGILNKKKKKKKKKASMVSAYLTPGKFLHSPFSNGTPPAEAKTVQRGSSC